MNLTELRELREIGIADDLLAAASETVEAVVLDGEDREDAHIATLDALFDTLFIEGVVKKEHWLTLIVLLSIGLWSVEDGELEGLPT